MVLVSGRWLGQKGNWEVAPSNFSYWMLHQPNQWENVIAVHIAFSSTFFDCLSPSTPGGPPSLPPSLTRYASSLPTIKSWKTIIRTGHQGNDLQCRSSHSFEPVLSTSPSTTGRSPLLLSHDSLSQNLPTIVHPAAHLNPPVQVRDHNCHHPSPSLSSSLFLSSHKGAAFRSIT